jgi:hypothetical protein
MIGLLNVRGREERWVPEIMDDQSNPLMILSLAAGYGLVFHFARPAVPDAVAAAVVLAMWTTPATAPADFPEKAGVYIFFSPFLLLFL